MRLTEADHALVTDAVTVAERDTDGEIVTIVAGRSDGYHDVPAHWAVLAMLSMLTLLALRPEIAERLYPSADRWSAPVPPGGLFTVALVLLAATFLVVMLLLRPERVRVALTPPATKRRRVRRRAVELFRTGAEKRTGAATAVLLYLSIAERRAEIVADAAIDARVTPEVWGDAMATLLTAVRDGRPGEGMAAAVTRIGAVLAEHFPRSEGDVNELPDRLIEL